MQSKQTESAHRDKEDTGLGQFRYCPSCGTQLAKKENRYLRRKCTLIYSVLLNVSVKVVNPSVFINPFEPA